LQGGTALHASSSAGLSTMVEMLLNGTYGKSSNVHVNHPLPSTLRISLLMCVIVSINLVKVGFITPPFDFF